MDTKNKKDLLEHLINMEINNLLDIKNTVDINMVCQLLTDIEGATDVIFIASRASVVLADYSAYIFNKIGVRSVGYDVSDTMGLDSIRNADRSTLIIAFAFPRYPKSTMVTARYLKNKGFKVVGITEGKHSPLTGFCDYCFDIKCDAYSFTDSYAPVILLINYIVALYGHMHADTAERQLKEFNEVAKQFSFYF